MSRCSVCQLAPEKRDAIDAGLRAQVPLGKIAEACGFSKSTLSRHGQHVIKCVTDAEVVRAPKAAAVARTRDATLTTTLGLPMQQNEPVAPPQVGVGPSKETLVSRIEQLWSESMDGLEASKETIKVRGRDGNEMELPGDLRARAGFIREARSVVELAGVATGHFHRGDTGSGQQVNITINCPAGAPAGQINLDDDGVTIDIG